MEYYGLLTDIIELDYYGKWKVVLFRCDWADVNTARGIKNDQFGFTMENFSRLIHTGEQLIDEQKMRRRRLRDLNMVQNTPNSEEANSEQQTVIGSSNVPETLDESAEFQTESGETRRGRGRTLLKDLYNLNPVERVKDREQVGTSSGKKQKFKHMAESRSFFSLAEAEEVSSGQKVGRLQLFEITHRKKDRSPMTSEAGEIMEKLKEKKAEYEAVASTDSSVNLENIDNIIITEVFGPERYGRIAQMQANTVEQIAEVERTYEELQQQLRADAAARETVAAARKAEAVAMAAEQSKKYDEL
ncbi:hypothetical protein PVK06_028597 [Gossypium arboreum]|uniref:DUF4216 domain-containing protein n=1 Tax=Gossypium arboreum TaxID=29729 RepID=A0ABR0P3G4_GOSAR|nr:hypothetical protein PVK06_028597 [Gossypium arboreum]